MGYENIRCTYHFLFALDGIGGFQFWVVDGSAGWFFLFFLVVSMSRFSHNILDHGPKFSLILDVKTQT